MRPARAFARSQAGLTLAETLVAATLLLIGALGTFALMDTANSTTAASRAREGATNLGREVLENARSVAYTKIGQPSWFQTQLQTLAGGSGTVTTPSTYAQRTTVDRRGIDYTVTVTPCSVDDSRDSYGAHAAGTNWCSDSASTGTSDGQPEDMKRVSASITWTVDGRSQKLDMAATFGSAGVAIGPAVASLVITAPSGLSGSTPTITVNPSGGIVTFRGTSIGAYDMRFTVNGTDQTTGVTNNANGTWSFNWNIASVKDGTYNVAAVAIDALGTRGQPLNIQITLNRNVPAPLANPTGGYNYVYAGGTKTLVVEGAWDANTEGNVTGYEMLRGTTSVCGGPSNQVPACMDLNPPTSGTTNYTIKTWYRDGAGNLQSLANTYPLTAPTTSAFPTRYYLTYNSSNPGGSYTGSTCKAGSGGGTKLDMLSTAPAFTARTSGNGWVSGCLPPFPSGVSVANTNATLNTKWINTANTDCSGMPVYVYLNGTTLIGGSGVNGGGTLSKISKNTSTSSPASPSLTFKPTAQSFSAGDQLSFYTPADTFSANCSGVEMYFNSSSVSGDVTLPLTGPGVTSLAQPAAVTGLTATPNGDGTTTLSWNASNGTTGADFYRVYRDGKDYDDRFDTVGDDGTSTTYSWTDSSTGGTSHTYHVTAASDFLVESNMAGPVTG
jgi:Tfp pilus assembly protein PilV